MLIDLPTVLRLAYLDTIASLHAKGLRGPQLRGALAALIAINAPSVSRTQSHAIVRFMGI